MTGGGTTGSPRVFRDREEAGRALAAALHGRVDRAHALVLAIPRGGVIVAAPVARALDAPLDVVIPHKLGAPHNPELAIGAVAPGVRVLDERPHPRPQRSRRATSRTRSPRRRRRSNAGPTLYRDDRPPPVFAGATAVVVDDGVATGATVDGGAAMGARAGFRARGVRGARRAGRPRSGCSRTSATTSSSWRHRVVPRRGGVVRPVRPGRRTSRCWPCCGTRREGVRDRARRGVRRARDPFARVLDPAAVREPRSPATTCCSRCS